MSKQRVVKILEAPLDTGRGYGGDKVEAIRIFTRHIDSPNDNNGVWTVQGDLGSTLGHLVIQVPITGTSYVAHVVISHNGVVRVAARLKVYDGTWHRLEELDIPEVITLRKLAK